MAGRKPKPVELHVVAGTFRPDRHSKNAPPPSSDQPRAPEHFDEAHRRYFDEVVARHAELGLASLTYQHVYEMVAVRRVEVDEAAEAIAEHGRVYTTMNKHGEQMVKANPAVAMRSEALRHLQSLYSELGLTPASRGKVGSTKSEKSANPFADLA